MTVVEHTWSTDRVDFSYTFWTRYWLPRGTRHTFNGVRS